MDSTSNILAGGADGTLVKVACMAFKSQARCYFLSLKPLLHGEQGTRQQCWTMSGTRLGAGTMSPAAQTPLHWTCSRCQMGTSSGRVSQKLPGMGPWPARASACRPCPPSMPCWPGEATTGSITTSSTASNQVCPRDILSDLACRPLLFVLPRLPVDE